MCLDTRSEAGECAMADDVVRIKVGVSMRAVHNSTQEDILEVPRSEWDAMTDKEREEYLDQAAQDHLANEVEAYAYVAEDEG